MAIKLVACLRGRPWHPHYPFNLLGSELVGVSGDTVPVHWGTRGGERRGGCTVDHSQCLFSRLTVSDCWLSYLLSSVWQPPHKASIIWKYQQRLYSAISPWLSDLSASPPSVPPLAFGPLTWKLIWLSSGAIVLAAERKPKWNIQLQSRRHFPPSSSILVFFFHGNPRAIYGRPQ